MTHVSNHRGRRSAGRTAISCLLIPSLLLASCQPSSLADDTDDQADRERAIVTVARDQAGAAADLDCDGMPDDFEAKYGLDPKDPTDAARDRDGDGVSSLEEYGLGGNPSNPDSDGNGTPDGVDLQQGLDLDGDGKHNLDDNCPQDPNPDQRDSDGDHRGDACDDDLPSVAIAEAYARPWQDWALLPLSSGTLSRTLDDRGELLAMPSSFRVFADASSPFGKTAALYELVHPTTHDHAYVSNTTDRGALLRQGYRDLGILGYVATKPMPLAGSVVVRRLVHAARHQEAVTIDAGTAQRLLADGFAEQPALGYALVDDGHLRDPRPVIRYAQAGLFRHQTTPLIVTGYTTDGPRFRVLPEKIAGARPLLRLRNAALEERLSSDPSEVEAFEAEGFVTDGLVGWLVDRADALPVHPAAELWRLERGAQHRYAVDPDELASLTQAGWSPTVVLGYAFPVRERAATCTGGSPVTDLEDKLRAMAVHPQQRAVATLTAIVTSCAIERVLDGNAPANAIEKRIQDKLPADAEVRRRMRANAARWHAIDPGLRAAALGEYAQLDPGACSGPIDVIALSAQTAAIFHKWSGPLPSLREPFCDGTLYGPADPARGSPQETRAVTVSAAPVGEFGDNNGARPRLAGVLDTTLVRGHAKAIEWAALHPDIGFNASGIPTGVPCSASVPCATSQGLRCEVNQCVAYPIVTLGQQVTFTGTNFWDVLDGQIQVRDTVTNAVTRINTEILSNEPDGPGRCALDGTTNRAVPEENLNLVAGRFFEVEVINKNGRFYEHDELVPDDDAVARANGRTIHLCWSPNDPNRPAGTVTDCRPLSAAAAACPLDGPSCTAATGGTWGAAGGRPRSLAFCEANSLQCGETPRELTSRMTDGRPQLIFVEQAPPKQRIVTTLQGVTCHNETGYDWAGSDELAVMLTSVASVAAAPNTPTLDATTNSYSHSYDSDDRHARIGSELAAVELTDSADASDGAAGYIVTLLEEDSGVWEAIVATVVIVGAFATAALLWPSIATVGVAIGAAAAGIAAMYLLWQYGPNDLLGRDVWFASIADVTDRGASSHDTSYAPLAPLTPFPGTDVLYKYVGEFEPSVHPAVDNVSRFRNAQVTGPQCAVDADCVVSEVCAIGLCVKRTWVDLEPGVTGQPPGFLEFREFVDGSESRYDIYLGWHVD